tara:strand:+ start:37 stop:990 length:954 start_codon:yes stop_codon:yes gene_type:complete
MASDKKFKEINDIIKKQFDQFEKVRQRADEIAETRRTLEDSFGSLTKALEKITAIKSNDPATIALQKVRKSTDSFQRIMEKHQQDLATINPLTGAVRKQRFKRPEITNQVVQSVKPKQPVDAEEARQKLIKFFKNKDKPQPKKKVQILADGRTRTHLYYGYKNGKEQSFQDWCWDNDVHDMFGIVKHYKKKKTRYKPIDWDDLAVVLRTLNFRPEEVLEYSISKIQTKERYLEHRLYRNIEARNASGLEDFIKIYKKHLETKLPFKSFFYSKALASWCASEDIFFNSEENCRVNKDLLVKAYNKKYPNDKINDKRKK